MAKPGKLTAPQKLFVTQALAHFQTPSEVAEAVRQEFGIEVARQSIHFYDPEHNPRLCARWRAAFQRERLRVLADLYSIGFAHLTFRMRELEKLYHRAKDSNPLLALKVLKQGAREMGGWYCGRSLDLSAWQPPAWDISAATGEQLRRMAAGEDPRTVLRLVPPLRVHAEDRRELPAGRTARRSAGWRRRAS